MKCKHTSRAGKAPPVLAMLVLLLTVGVVATTPLAFAKYVASANAAATARVAKWDFYYYTNDNKTPSGLFTDPAQPFSTAYLSGTKREGPGSYDFCVFSSSEVMANVKIEIRYETSDGTYLPAAVTESSPLFASYSSTDTTVSHGLTASSFNNNAGDPNGSNGTASLGRFEVEYEPGTSWAWFSIPTQATTSAPTGTTINNCMRSYKVFVKAVQID